MSTKYRDRLYDLSCLLLGITIIAELLFLIYVNLFKLGDMVDVDFARVLRHVMEMGDKRTIFLPYWDYITTAELDHSALFALPLYILTGNIMLSYGIANLINICLWCVILYRLTGFMELTKPYRLLAGALVFAVYDMGMLAYTNMLFFGAEHYTHKVMLPLMFVMLLLTPADKRHTAGNIILNVIFCILLLVTGISSGIYVFICGILPVIGYMIVRYFTGPIRNGSNTVSDKKYPVLSYEAVMCMMTVLITAAGLAICRINGVTPNSELAMFKSFDTVKSNIFSTFFDLMEMFRVFPERSVPVMSLTAVMSIVRMFIFAVVLIFGLRSVGKLTAAQCAEQLLISIFLWNYFILFVSGSQQRYHILGAVPLMLCAVGNLQALTVMEQTQKVQNIADDPDARILNWHAILYSAIAGALILLDMYQILWGSRQYLHREDYSRAVNAAVISFMEENDVDTAFSLYETGYGTEWLRIADKSRIYETYIPDTGEIISHDYYYSHRDRSAYGDRNALIATRSEFDACSEYIRDNYTLAGEAYNYDIYLSEHNPIDGMSGMLKGLDTVDLATAPGYEIQGDIGADGELVTKVTGNVLASPVFAIDTPCELVINYSKDKDTDFVVELYLDGSSVAKLSPDEEEGQLRYVFPEGGNWQFDIDRSGDGMLCIKSMDWTSVVK